MAGLLDTLGGWSRRRAREDQAVRDFMDGKGPFALKTPTFSAELSAPRELTGYASDAYATRVSREVALTVPAVKRARDIICGTLGRLPVRLHDRGRQVVDWALLDQPELGTPASVTYAKTYEDMLLEGVAFWVVTDWRGMWPSAVVRADARTAQVREIQVVVRDSNGAVVGYQTRYKDRPGVIRFDSPNPPLLKSGARAINTLLRLEKSAAVYADEPPAHTVFTPAEGADPADDTDIEEMLNKWAESRRIRSTGYVPAAVKMQQLQAMTPEQLQMGDSRQRAVLEIARLTGIDPEDLGVSTTSRTYQNAEQRRLDLIDFTLAAYSSALDDRLRMSDTTPLGHVVRTDYAEFARADELTRMQTYEIGRRVGAYDDDRIAIREFVPSAKVPEPPAQPVPASPKANGGEEK